jgi:GNAT superfamily N-acetyltransferase
LGYVAPEQYLASQAAYPVHEERTVALKNGAEVLIRPARAADAGALQTLFHRLSPDDVYTRFFRRVRALAYAELQTLCNVNHETEVAFLATTGPRENEEVVGSACYFLNPTTNLAEVAFMVAPEWQGAGLGSALQARLQEYAVGRGVRGFVAEIPAKSADAAPGRPRAGHGDDLARRGRGPCDHPVRRPGAGWRPAECVSIGLLFKSKLASFRPWTAI